MLNYVPQYFYDILLRVRVCNRYTENWEVLKLGSQDSAVPFLPLPLKNDLAIILKKNDLAIKTLSCSGGYMAQHNLGHHGTSVESFQREDTIKSKKE